MDFSEEIPDQSPFFIVPSSQDSECGSTQTLNGVVFKGLTMLQPSLKNLSKSSVEKHLVVGDKTDEDCLKLTESNKEQHCLQNIERPDREFSTVETLIRTCSDVSSKGSNSSDSTMPNTSSSEACSHDTTSSTSSKDNLSDEWKATKKHALFLTRHDRQKFQTSTPMLQSDAQRGEILEHLTPVECRSATSLPQQDESRCKETSSSDDVISPSEDLGIPSSRDETGKYVAVLSPEKHQKIAYKQHEKVSTDVFQCLQLSGETLATESSAAVVISPSSEHLVPDSPKQGTSAIDAAMHDGTDKNDRCIEPTSATDMCKERTGSTLPLWQQNMTRTDRASPTTEALSKSSSDASTISSREISTQESSVHRWQSLENGSDCDMFEADQQETPPSDNVPKSNSLRDEAQPHFKALSLPELSQDIFRPKEKGVTGQKEMRGQCIRLNGDAPSMENVLDRRTTELEPSPDDVILPSQDDVFCLHMSQSQSSVVASQPRSQPDGKIATFNAEPRDVMHWERNVENAVSLLGNKENVPNAITSPTTGDDLIDNLTSRVNERNLGNIETSPTTNENMTPKPNERDKVNTIPSLTNMETLNDIKTSTDNEDNRLNNVTSRNKKIAGGNVTPPYSRLSDTILVQTPRGHPSNTVHQRDIHEIDTDEAQTTQECVSSICRLDLQAKADSKLNESVESIESSVVGFHFSPPVMLLKPVTRNSPPCLETRLETVQDSSQGIVSTSEFRPILPDVFRTSPDVVTLPLEPAVPMLSFSVPVVCEEGTEEQRFSLQKEILNDDAVTTLQTPSVRSIFTNIQERFESATACLSVDEIDPFEFRDEEVAPPLLKRKRKLRAEYKSDAKKKKTRKQYPESNLVEQPESQPSSQRVWKIVRTRLITTTTKLTETQTEIIYTTLDDVIISRESRQEFSEPTYETTTSEKETREEMDATSTRGKLAEASRMEESFCPTASVQSNSNITNVEAPGSRRMCRTAETVERDSITSNIGAHNSNTSSRNSSTVSVQGHTNISSVEPHISRKTYGTTEFVQKKSNISDMEGRSSNNDSKTSLESQENSDISCVEDSHESSNNENTVRNGHSNISPVEGPTSLNADGNIVSAYDISNVTVEPKTISPYKTMKQSARGNSMRKTSKRSGKACSKINKKSAQVTNSTNKKSISGVARSPVSKQHTQTTGKSNECFSVNSKDAQFKNRTQGSETANSFVRKPFNGNLPSRLKKALQPHPREPNGGEPTPNQDVIMFGCGNSFVNEPSKPTLTPGNVSPPLFPPSSNSTSSANVSDPENISMRKHATAGAPSLPRQKRKRSSDNQGKWRNSTVTPNTPRVFSEGTRVFALWYDTHYYPGNVISKCSNARKYRVNFDDGTGRDLCDESIIAVDYLPCDQPVMFCEEPGGEYVEGLVRGFYKHGDEREYKVFAKDSNRAVSCPRGNVMLTAEQAAIFLSLESMLSLKAHGSNSNLADIELRARNSNGKSIQKHGQKCAYRGLTEQDTNKSRPSREDGPNGPLTDKDTNAKQKARVKRKILPMKKKFSGRDENDRKVLRDNSTAYKKSTVEKIFKQLPQNNKLRNERKERKVNHENSSASETPKSSRKSTGKKSAAGNLTTIGGNNDGKERASHVRRRLSTVMKSSRNIPERSSPRKSSPKMTDNENLILPTNKDLFRGFGFILTGIDVIFVSDNSSSGEEAEVFVRRDVISQIKAGGGEVLSKFIEGFSRDSCFLLSNCCQTTAKYFNALVLGVPCLSHAWVRDCCMENRLLSFKNYMLPAGRDLITNNLVEEQKYKNALCGLKVHLVGEDEFKQQWTEVLKCAGCEVIPKLPSNILQKLQNGDSDFVCDVIVVGSGHLAHSTIQKARLLSIPTVAIHWVKQCILTGSKVDFNAHQSFIY